MKFDQENDSVFSFVYATPSQLTDSMKVEKLIQLNRITMGVATDDSSFESGGYMPMVITGPSGAGKGTLMKHLTDTYPDKFGFSVSSTTRAPREGEVDGVDYNFIKKEQFEQMIDNNEFIEWAKVHSNMYGTTKAQIQKIQAGKKIPLLDIDVQGAFQFHKSFPNSNFIAVLPPDSEAL